MTKEIAAAASEFVATLDESQQGKLIYDFRDEAQRKRHFPPGSPHAEDYAWAISRSGSEVLDRSDATDDDLRSRSRHGKQTA